MAPPGGPSLTRGWPSLEPYVSGHISNLCPLPDTPAEPPSPSVDRKHRQLVLHSGCASGFLNIQLPGQRWGERDWGRPWHLYIQTVSREFPIFS